MVRTHNPRSGRPMAAALGVAAAIGMGLAGTAGTASAAPVTAAAASVTTASAASSSTAGSSTAGSSRGPASCRREPWQARVQGRPADFAAGERGGDYLWHDAAGFHLRVTHRGDGRAVYTGEITADAPVHLSPVRLEKGDLLKLSANHRSIVFAFVDHGYVDGANFQTDCAARITVSHLHVGNAPLPASRVQLGARRVHPAGVPFAITR